MSNCCIIGLGYIGLPTAALIAMSNHNVIGVDINQNILEMIRNGHVHFYEPGLLEILKKVISNKKMTVSNKPTYADVFIIAVPTPFKKNLDSLPEPDIQFVLSAAESIAPFLQKGNLIIIESTSPVGTTEKVRSLLKNKSKCNVDDLHICYCPERVIPGNILKELVENNRVIGGIKKLDAELAKEFYKSFCKGDIKISDARTAELVKLTENTFRDVNIAFANELSIICDELNVDVEDLINLSNQHPRVNILKPSCGVGGHCIAVDPWFLVSAAPDSANLIRTAREVNNAKISWVETKIQDVAKQFFDENCRNPTICCLGLTFKPNVDDIRESPAKKIVENLISFGLKLMICEPNLKNIQNINLDSLDDVVCKSDIIVFLVAHDEFKKLNLENEFIMDFCGVSKFL